MKTRTINKETDRKIYNRLKRWLDHASEESIAEGLNWYSDAQQFTRDLSRETGVDPYTVAAVVSALSPNNKWDRNKIDAAAIINAYITGQSFHTVKVCTYNANKHKAIKLLQSKTRIRKLSPKTHAFAMNIGRLSGSHITIDRWHMRACIVDPKEGPRPCIESPTIKQYQRIEQITARVANDVGLLGYELQAIIWLAIKSNWNR